MDALLYLFERSSVETDNNTLYINRDYIDKSNVFFICDIFVNYETVYKMLECYPLEENGEYFWKLMYNGGVYVLEYNISKFKFYSNVLPDCDPNEFLSQLIDKFDTFKIESLP